MGQVVGLGDGKRQGVAGGADGDVVLVLVTRGDGLLGLLAAGAGGVELVGEVAGLHALGGGPLAQAFEVRARLGLSHHAHRQASTTATAPRLAWSRGPRPSVAAGRRGRPARPAGPAPPSARPTER